ncbi:MAG: hypothetical protein K5778_08850 [Bacteroidaceae bacterium]|nr:hypothetical protein [Bacteroidaceae bacterium]
MDNSTLSYILGGICVVIALVELYFLRRMLHAFRPLRDENRLSDIEQGRSHFRFVPSDIGPLTFAASTHYVPTFLSTKEKSKFVGLTVLYVTLTALVVGLLAYFLWDNRSTWATSTIIMSFVTLLLLILLLCIFTVYAWKYIPFKCRRQATDMFVGHDGISLYKFKDTREEMTESKTIPFANVHNILRKREAASSKKNRIEYMYIGTDASERQTGDVELLKLRATHNTLLNKPATLQFLEAADTAYATWQQTQAESRKQQAEDAELRARAEAAEQAEAQRAAAEAQRLAAEQAEAAERAKKTDTTDYFSSTATFN